LKLLLDTHAFLWYCAGDAQLSGRAKAAIETGNNNRFLSIASLIEIAIKISLGRLSLSMPYQDFVADGVDRLQCSILHLTPAHLEKLSVLPFHHRDPFDRLLVAQAMLDDLDVLSIDKELEA
jgi:PIN domain nuclease of toxin-antitoxin system